MKNPPKVTKKSYGNRTPYWLVTYSIKGEGQKKPKFDSERAANEHKQEMIRKYMGGISMEDQELARLGFDTFKAQQAGNKDLSKIDFVKLVKWGCQNYQAPLDLTVEDLVDEFMTIKRSQNLRPDTIKELNRYLDEFVEKFNDRSVETFTKADMEKYLKKTYAWNQNRFTVIKHFFSWCNGTSVATPNANPILRDTPFRGWISGKKDDDSIDNVVIFNSDDARGILEVAGKPEYSSQGMFAFMFFSGCRPAESFRIWDDIQKYGWNLINMQKRILTIPASVSKTRKARQVVINDTLYAWLKKYEKCETLLPISWNDKYRYIRKDAKVSMVKDVARHTFISQSLEQGMTFDQAALQCGNSRNIILKHYASLTSKDDSDKFFALTPDHFDSHDLPREKYEALMKKQRLERLGRQSKVVKKRWAKKKRARRYSKK